MSAFCIATPLSLGELLFIRGEQFFGAGLAFSQSSLYPALTFHNRGHNQAFGNEHEQGREVINSFRKQVSADREVQTKTPEYSHCYCRPHAERCSGEHDSRQQGSVMKIEPKDGLKPQAESDREGSRS